MNIRESAKKLNNDNRGVTLVEVVISLLIIAVIFTPLLMTFVQASKVNRMTNTNAYAQEAGENIMEQVKAMGVVGYAEYADTQSTIAMPTPYIVDGKFFVPLDGGGKRKPYDDYYYEITGLRQGTGEYDAIVTISSSVYKSPTLAPGTSRAPDPTLIPGTTATPTPIADLNDYVFADFSAFSSDKTVLIYPKTGDTEYIPPVKPGTPAPSPTNYAGFDDKAISYFRSQNEEHIEQMFLRAREQVEAYNALHPDDQRPTPTMSPTQPADSIERTMTRNIVISIEKNELGNSQTGRAPGIGYVVNSYVEYLATSSAFYEDEHQYVKYGGYCNDVYTTDLKSIFLLYTEPEHTIREHNISVVSGAGIEVDLYIAIQVKGGKTDESDYPSISIQEDLTNSTKINYYSQGEIRGASAIIPETRRYEGKLVKDMATASNRLFQITIEVYEHDEEEKWSNLITTIKSAYVNDTEIK